MVLFMYYRISFILFFGFFSACVSASNNNLFFEDEGCINIGFDSSKGNNIFYCYVDGDLTAGGVLKRDKDYIGNILQQAKEINDCDYIDEECTVRAVIFSYENYFKITKEGYIIESESLDFVKYFYKNIYLSERESNLNKLISKKKYKFKADECVLLNSSDEGGYYACGLVDGIVLGSV